MARIITVNGDGVQAASLAEIVTEMQSRYREKIGEDLALSPQTPQAQVLGITASITSEILEALVEDVNANSVDHAGGVLLTQLGSLLDIKRVQASHSRVTVTLTGVSGIGVPAGSRARTNDGALFETLSDAVLSPSGVMVDMQAVEAGPVAAPAGELTTIVSVIAGWESITNPNAAALGIDGQSDQDYRLTYQARTGRVSAGAEAAIRAAIDESEGKKQKLVENKSNTTMVVQEWPVFGHSIAVVAESGSDGDIRRSVETRRGQGVGTMAAIIGGAPNTSALDSTNGGSISWNGAPFTGLDLRSATTPADKAEALTTLLAEGTPPADPPVTIRAIDGLYLAFYGWTEGDAPTFAEVADGTVAADFGLLAASATPAPGPFARTRDRALVVSVDVARQPGFPADGLTRIRNAILDVANGYDIGQQAWLNDFLVAIERIPGTRASNLTATHGGEAVSGVAIPLDSIWRLAPASITINIT